MNAAPKFRLIIAGTRGFVDLLTLSHVADNLLSDKLGTHDLEIVSGTARGADQTGEAYAISRGIPIKRMPAQWDRYGKSAGYRRNEEMAAYADALLAFWDGESRGTRHMINIANERMLVVRVYNYLAGGFV